MDWATIGGLLISGAAIFFSIVASGGMEGFASFIDVPSLVIVLGGGIGATLISYPLKHFLAIFSVVKKVFSSTSLSSQEIINKFIDMSKIVRKEGLLKLESVIEEEQDEFLRKSVKMAIDGTKTEDIRATLENEIDCSRVRHGQSQGIFATMAAQFPAWGMIGTLIGLVMLLQSLDDPTTIGPSMAVAIITTLYGSFFANYICNPISKKLEIYSEEEILKKTLIIEGVIALVNKTSPIIMEQSLNSFLSDSQKKQSLE